jgi:hypothetical protein
MATRYQRKAYTEYLHEHLKNVRLGFEWFFEHLNGWFDGYDAEYIGDLCTVHDESKYSEEEFDAYAEYFYGEKNAEVKEAFDLAWLHHQHHNPHHWQHWLLQEDEGKMKALEMPYEYCIEMIADWWAFSWKSSDLYEIFNWYKDHKSRMTLHPKTLETVENLLKQLEEKLHEVLND